MAYLSMNVVGGSLLAVVVYYFLQPYAIGWRLALLLPIATLLVKAVLVAHLPESPRWLLARKTPAGERSQSNKLQ